jgi:hypothetical protein
MPFEGWRRARERRVDLERLTGSRNDHTSGWAADGLPAIEVLAS